MSAVLLTGATGLLGQYLLRDLLLAGRSVAVLVRSASRHSARQRVDQVLRRFERESQRTLPRPVVLEGSLDQDGLGLEAADRDWVAHHCAEVIHSAASLKFVADEATGEPYATNVLGTRRLLHFCLQTGILDFHHVSTAYVCGERTGRVRESDPPGTLESANAYLQTKAIAEQELRGCTQLRSLSVYRPSIVVGDSRTGYTSTYHGFYLPLQLGYALTKAGFIGAGQNYREALGLSGHESKNLVPVDWVSAVLVRIFNMPVARGATYHLTHSDPVLARDIETAIVEAVREALPEAQQASEVSLTPDQLASFQESMEVYRANFSDDPLFDATHRQALAPDLPCPRWDAAGLKKLAKFAIDANFGWPKPPVLPVDFDAEERMLRLPLVEASAVAAPALRLQVSGSWGGCWYVSAEGATLNRTKPRDCEADAYFNVHTMQRILLGHQSVGEALAEGRIALRSTNGSAESGLTLLEALFRRLRESE